MGTAIKHPVTDQVKLSFVITRMATVGVKGLSSVDGMDRGWLMMTMM